MQLFHFPDVSSCSHSTEQLHPVDPPNRSAVMRSVRPHAGTNSSPTDSIVIKAEMRGGVYCTNVLINSCRGRWRLRAPRRHLRSTRAISKTHLWFEGIDRYLRPIDSRIHPMAQSIHKTHGADSLQGAEAKMRARGAVWHDLEATRLSFQSDFEQDSRFRRHWSCRKPQHDTFAIDMRLG
jgi:hypothetical protein